MKVLSWSESAAEGIRRLSAGDVTMIVILKVCPTTNENWAVTLCGRSYYYNF